MEQGSWIEYHPLTAVRDGGPIEFEISGSGEDYIDFANSVLYVKAKITANNGGNLAADAEMGPVNLFLHSLHCGSKNAPTLADYNYDPVQSILTTFTKLFLDDDKSCLVVNFSTSPHICSHYTL